MAPDGFVCDACAKVVPENTAPFLYDPKHRTANRERRRSR